jgi:hypothetical protein
MSPLSNRLAAWLGALDGQIGDTQAEIDKRRESNSAAVEVRDDLLALIHYVETKSLPENVTRALERCLSWNPHAVIRIKV